MVGGIDLNPEEIEEWAETANQFFRNSFNMLKTAILVKTGKKLTKKNILLLTNLMVAKFLLEEFEDVPV